MREGLKFGFRERRINEKEEMLFCFFSFIVYVKRSLGLKRNGSLGSARVTIWWPGSKRKIRLALGRFPSHVDHTDIVWFPGPITIFISFFIIFDVLNFTIQLHILINWINYYVWAILIFFLISSSILLI